MDNEAILKHFSKIILKGSYNDRANIVYEYIRSHAKTKEDDFFCIAEKDNTECFSASIHLSDNTKSSILRNNGVKFYFGKLRKLQRVDDFKTKVRLAIDLAEQDEDASLDEKKEIFKRKFPGLVNIIVSDGNFYSHFVYSWDCFFSEQRGDTRYVAWLNG